MHPALPRLILGSTSPYRRELLARLRLPFDVVAPMVDETPSGWRWPRRARSRRCTGRRW
jgi:septum formation protein